MRSVDRHKFHLDQIELQRRNFREALELDLEGARESASEFNLLIGTAATYTGLLSVGDIDVESMRRSISLLAETSCALFKLAGSADGSTQEVDLGGKKVHLSAKVPESIVDAHNWLTGLYAAAVCRRKDILEQLCRTGVDQLRQSSTRSSESVYRQVEALKGFWAGAPDTPQRILAAMEATDPAKSILADWTLHFTVPQLDVLFRLLEEDAVALNDSLRKGLEAHRAYWKKGKRKQDPEGFISLSMTALAAIANDRGIPVTVSSDYTPPLLVTGAQ